MAKIPYLRMANSNFCEPQFIGILLETEWHHNVTNSIKKATVSVELKSSKLVNRLAYFFKAF